VSLAITIHFFATIVSLAANLSPSELERRILKLLTPYTVGLHQDYQGVPLDMTRGSEVDFPCQFEIRRAGSEQWQTVEPPRHFASAWDRRWRTFERMADIVAIEQNEPLVYLVFEQCVRREEVARDSAAVDSVRLVRRAALSYAADQAYVAGELPVSENQDRTLYECRVVKLDADRIKLIPVLESMRTSKSLSKPGARSAQGPPTAGAATGQAEEEEASLETQP
jgi:hypothetical protein